MALPPSPGRRAPAPALPACCAAGVSGDAPYQSRAFELRKMFFGQTVEPERAGLVTEFLGHRCYPIFLPSLVRSSTTVMYEWLARAWFARASDSRLAGRA